MIGIEFTYRLDVQQQLCPQTGSEDVGLPLIPPVLCHIKVLSECRIGFIRALPLEVDTAPRIDYIMYSVLTPRHDILVHLEHERSLFNAKESVCKCVCD